MAEDNASTLHPLGSNARNQWRVNASTVDMVRPPRSAHPLNLTSRERQLRFDLSRSAIVVIDMQNDFCHPDGWLASIGVDIAPARAPIAPLQRLLPLLRQSNVPVIWVNWGSRPDQANLTPSVLHVYNPDGISNGIGKPLPSNGAPVLEKGSWAAAVVDELCPEARDISVDKFRMSGFQDTELDSVLRNLDISTVLFAGVNADQCVACTLQDANFAGYDCLYLEDCCATTSPSFCLDATLYNVQQCFGFVINSDEIVAQLDSTEACA